jgi:hypothetical protein
VSKANNEMDEIGTGIQDIQTIGYDLRLFFATHSIPAEPLK